MSRVPPFPDLPALLSVFVEHEVRFLVLGGVAVAHHGFPRATKDLDIVPEPSRENLARLWQALLELEAEPLSLGDFEAKELPAQFDLDGLLQPANWDLSTKHGRVDLLQFIAGKLETADDYKQLEEAADEAHYDFGTVSFVGYEDLLDFKNIAGRDQDLIDIRALREARDETAP